ncbi:host specificity protein J [Dickeya dadantii]|uniref:host specificity protein J n=1 Tax=Dickeya dadantii TaxID=204038 RepID=UPI0014959E0C|nr:phage tail protein [Dickeya dadantii]NPE57744.1 host specificity protein J [Dickeya dadantii]NPE69780.1 host specificity protein J [Dickeya dadantii]
MSSGGGGGASTPALLNDNLTSKQFYRVLDLISEGPIYGPVDQTYLSSFLVNKTPVTGASGATNINGVSVAWRPGSMVQPPITGFDAIEATTIVNNAVTFDTPLVRTVTDDDVARVRVNLGVSGLVQQDTAGNQSNTSVTMVIETRAGSGGAYQIAKMVTISGKISGEYLEAHIIDAPGTTPFDIRIRRITPDSTSDLLTNGTVWNSYTEITDESLNYPYSAIAGAVIDRSQYTDTPSRTYHLRGIIVDVPDNYDPTSRTYSGIWTGGFKSAWTDNPAWLFRALVKHKRYGLARRAGDIDVDDGTLYVLSQFCDQSVSDGYGGIEPRLRLNAYITEQANAREILDKIASMFRGIALWDGMRLSVMIDNPQDPVASITNANVVDGLFTGSSVPRSERYNAVVVSWTNPANGWEQDKEYVSDDTLIGRYGYNETTLEAFGCTSRGQAYRAGRWLLETAKRESRKVTFRMARDAIAFMPGDIVEVMDNNYAGTRLGGRILSHGGQAVTVDADISALVSSGDTISIMGSTGKLTRHEIQSVSGRVVTLKAAPAYVRDGTVFVISTGEVAARLFRITSVKEDENSTYTITAQHHDPNKQAVVDEGAVFDVPTDTLNGYRVPNVENLRIVNVASETVQVRAAWETATTTRKLVFELYVYNESGAVVAQHETEQFQYEFYGLNAGNYTLGARGRNDNGMKGTETQVSMVIGAPLAPSSVVWTPGIFSAGLVPVMSVSATTDTTFEFWYSSETRITDISSVTTLAQYLGRATQWALHGLRAETTYYMYVRTKNAFGVSGFVEASGQASADIPGMLEYIDEAIRDTGAFDNLQNGIDGNIEATLQNALATNAAVERQYAQYGEVRADVITIRTTVANLNGSLAELTDIVQAQYGELTAAVNQKLTAEVTSSGAASAFYTLNLGVIRDGTKYNTGFGMGIEPDGSGGYKSTVVFSADQFGVYSGSTPGNYQRAFFIYNGQVFINSAFIQDGSITNAKIANAAITNAKISGAIYSDNWNGVVGWNLDKAGGFQMGAIGTGRVKLDGTGLAIYTTAGAMVAKLGWLS